MRQYGKFMFVLLFCFVLHAMCSKKIEISHVKGIKCTDCSTVVYAETTITRIDEKQAEGKVRKMSTGNFIFEYKDTLCETCIAQKEIQAEEYYQQGLKAYQNKDYNTARQKFIAANSMGHKDAFTWLTKANEKIAAIEVRFDIPGLLKMNIGQVKKKLGKPVSEFKPTATQLKLDPSFLSTVEYQKGSTNIQIDYSKNGKIKMIFISDRTAGRTKEAIMKLGNLKSSSSLYKIRIQQWLNPQKARQSGNADIAGIEVMPY